MIRKTMNYLLTTLLVGLALLATSLTTHAEGPPAAAARWQPAVTQAVQSVYGLNGPVARIGALAQVESAWDPLAESKYAQGLTQFTPQTSAWMAEIYPALRPADPWNAEWSLLAASMYTKKLLTDIKPINHAIPACDHWAMDLAAYNGGPTNLKRDRALAAAAGADPDCWFGHTELHSRRDAWAFAENRAYPVKVLLKWEPKYLAGGWPGTAVCQPDHS